MVATAPLGDVVEECGEQQQLGLLERGDRLEVIQPGGNHEIIVGDMLRDGHGPVDVAGGSGVYVELDLGQVQPGALLAKILQ